MKKRQGLANLKNKPKKGRGGGQVVSMLAFYSDDPSSNPADVPSFYEKFEKPENKQQGPWLGQKIPSLSSQLNGRHIGGGMMPCLPI